MSPRNLTHEGRLLDNRETALCWLALDRYSPSMLLWNPGGRMLALMKLLVRR